MNMSDPGIDELHIQLGLLQTLDVGLVVIDKDYRILMWNKFMENHSGLLHSQLDNASLFQRFPELPSAWLKHKVDSVFLLKNRSFITWEQRPYLFQFKSYRPITGNAPFMYQNITLIPLGGLTGNVEHVGILIYDVTDTAMGKLALEKANLQLLQLSQTDRLTGLLNRGYWETSFIHEFERFGRTQTKSSLMMLDIDHFKRINDTYGHPAGDAVLREFSALLKQVTRNTDLVGRYGGEEFAILLIDSSSAQVQPVIQRLRQGLSKLVVKYLEHEIRFTISIGLTEVSNLFQTHEQWLKLADNALYQSKQNGRDQVTILNAQE